MHPTDVAADIVLVQPPIRDFYLTAKRTIPYGLACIAAPLQAAGFRVRLLDALATARSRIKLWPEQMAYLGPYYGRPDQSPFGLFHHYRHFGYSVEHIARQVRASGAFLVGIASLFTAYSREALATARAIRKFHPDCRIVLGGHHPTALPRSVMACRAVDFVLRGEGEVSMPQLARALKAGSRLENIPGIVLRRPDGRLVIRPPAVMSDLDHYPLPAEELIDARYYRRRKRPAKVLMASRGCPLTCSYCALGSGSVFAYRRRNVAAVLHEIETAIESRDIGFIDFEDENISLDRSWFLTFLHAFQHRFGGGGIELRAMNGLFPPSLDTEIIAAMKTAGFKSLNLALGSSCPAQLRKFRRPDVRPALDRAIDAAGRQGLETVVYIISGAPDQDPADSVRDLLYLACRPVLVGLSVFYPAPDSTDYEHCRRLGILPPDTDLMRSSTLPLCQRTSRLDSVTLLRLARVLNFMKALIDQGKTLPPAAVVQEQIQPPGQHRRRVGRHLLGAFLRDGSIRGVTPDGQVYPHQVAPGLCRQFLDGLSTIELHGSGGSTGGPA